LIRVADAVPPLDVTGGPCDVGHDKGHGMEMEEEERITLINAN
jgi:hypothetical protein